MEKLCSRLIDGRALAAGLFLQFPDFFFSEQSDRIRSLRFRTGLSYFYQTLTKLSIPMIKLGHKIILAVLALLITPPLGLRPKHPMQVPRYKTVR